jgi:hypothetical protein
MSVPGDIRRLGGHDDHPIPPKQEPVMSSLTLQITKGLAIAMAVSLLPAPRAAAQGGGVPVEVFGFGAAAEGNATLTKTIDAEGNASLKVSNLGSSGLDGVRVSFGDDGAEGSSATLQPFTGDAGATTYYATEGEVNGAGPVVVSEFQTLTNGAPPLPPGCELAFDFPGLGVATSTVRLYDEGWLVGEYQGFTPDDLIMTAAGPGTVYTITGTSEAPIIQCVYFTEPAEVCALTTGTGGTTHRVGRVISSMEVIPDVPAPTTIVLTAQVQRFANMLTNEVTIDGMAMQILDQWVTGNDEAQVTKKGGKLKISNLGSSGCDGFSVSGGGGGGGGPGESTAELSADIEPLSNAGPLGPGTVLDIRVDAIVQGELHEDFASMTVVKDATPVGDSLGNGCDPKMPQTTWFITWCLDGIAQYSAPMGAQDISVNGLFDSALVAKCITDPAGGESLVLKCEPAVQAIVDGVGYLVDEMRLTLPAADAWRVSDKVSMSIETDRVLELTSPAMDSTTTAFLDAGHQKHHGHVTVLKQPLSGGGPLKAGSLNGLMLADGPPNGIAGLFLGFDANPTAFKGGLLVPVPVVELFVLSTDATGSIDIPFVWPAGIPAGLSTYAQYAVQQPGPPPIIWLSNALDLISQ